MAKNTKNGGGSKVRFIMLEADIADGDFSQITTAISNALKPQQMRQIALPAVNGYGKEEAADPEPLTEQVDTGEDPTPKHRAPRSKKPSYRSPEVLTEVDLKGGDMPFEMFAKAKAPKSDLKKYLVTAYWFKVYRNVPSVTTDHVYTCFKLIGWSTAINNFAQPLHDLSRQSLGKMENGSFTINHLGEAKIDKMGSSGGDE